MGVGKRGDRLVIDFRCYLPDGRRVRCKESEGLNNPQNKKRVQQKWKAVEYHLNNNTFNYLEFFPHGSKAKHFDIKKDSDVTYAKFHTEWLKQLTVRDGTESGYMSVYKNHIEKHFGHWKLSDITDNEIKKFRKNLKFKESTINQIIKVLCFPLKEAARQNVITEYPCEYIKRIKEGKTDIDPFNFDELRHLLDFLYKKDIAWHDLFLFWSRTGLRPGELFALKWEHIDLFNKQVSIRESLTRTGKDGPVKTDHSNRTISLRPKVMEVVERQKARTQLIDKWVFLNHQQKQWNQTSFAKAFRFQLKLAGMRDRTPKQMRHTFATLHIGAGESITWVSKTLGHSDVETTLKRYNRFIPNLTRDDGSAFESVFDQEETKVRRVK